MPPPDASSLLVELLYEHQVGLDEAGLLAEVNKTLPDTVLAGDDRQPTLLVHEDYGDVYPFDGPAVPVMSVLMTADRDDQLKDQARIDLSRRGSSAGAEVLDRCRSGP